MSTQSCELLGGRKSALITAILLGVVLYFARDIFIPLVLAGLLAFLLAPAADRLERWKLKRLPAAFIVILLCVAGLVILGWALIGQVYNLAVELPRYQQNVATKIESLHLHLNGQLTDTLTMLTKDRDEILSAAAVPSTIPPRDETKLNADHPSGTIQAQHPAKTTRPVPVKIEQPGESITTIAGRTAMPLIHPVTTVFVVVIFLIFMLLGREDLRDRGLKLVGKGRLHITTEAIAEASQRVSRYLRMQLIVNLFYGVTIGLALWAIGVPNPLLWAVLTCLLRFIPYIGFLLAVSGPLLLSIAVSPHWGTVMWTALTFTVVELSVANFVEPMLYGASTGISPIGVLVAAIFWTFLWGLPGLLLSTPLTVCLVVIGRQISHLEFLDILFGDNEALSPPDRFYQRLLASKMREALTLLQDASKAKTIEQVHDSLVIPALSMIEEARHSDEITGARAEELFQSIEDLTEDIFGAANAPPPHASKSSASVVCVPARDFADEIACQLAVQVLDPICSACAISADSSTAEMLHYLEARQPDAICVVGIPPQAIRPLRMRCHQVRANFPNLPLIACALSEQCDLSKIRSRVPIEDAQHVVCSLQLMKDYLFSLLNPSLKLDEQPTSADAEAAKELNETEQKFPVPDVFDEPKESIFNHLISTLAQAFDAPIALIAAADCQRHFWESHCGLPNDLLLTADNKCNLSICRSIEMPTSGLVIADAANDQRFALDPFLQELGIRFFAGAPLRTHENETIGLLCVLDTRTREIGDKQKNLLLSFADDVVKAIELHSGEESQLLDSSVTESSVPMPTNR